MDASTPVVRWASSQIARSKLKFRSEFDFNASTSLIVD